MSFSRKPPTLATSPSLLTAAQKQELAVPTVKKAKKKVKPVNAAEKYA